MRKDFFRPDRNTDLPEILGMLVRMKQKTFRHEDNSAISNFSPDDSTFERDRDRGMLKYTQDQIDAGDYEPKDFELASEALAQFNETEMFMSLRRVFWVGPPVSESIVRLEQESKIAEDLKKGKSLLIRGNWRQGKSTMLINLIKHLPENSVVINSVDNISQKTTLSELQGSKEFDYNIANSIANNEIEENDDILELEQKIRLQIKDSGMSSIDYWNNYLKERGEQGYLFIDEVIAFAEEPEKLKYFADLKEKSNITVATVLHHKGIREDMFDEVFEGYETYYAEPLSLSDFTKLVRGNVKGTSIKHTDEAIAKLYEITGGRPIELNTIMEKLFSVYSNCHNPRILYRVSDVDVVNFEFPQKYELYENINKNYKKIIEIAVTERQKGVLIQLIDEEVPVDSLDTRDLEELLQPGLINVDKNKKVITINGLMFREFLVTYRKEKIYKL